MPCISQLREHVPGVSSILTICERVALHMAERVDLGVGGGWAGEGGGGGAGKGKR